MKIFAFTRSLFRTRLDFHVSWYLAFTVITAVIVTRFPEYYSFAERLLLGLAASGLFFLAMIVRQFFINVTSYYQRIPLKRVVLYPFGGVPLTAREQSQPILEVLLAVVGLLSSLIVVVVFYLAYVLLVVKGSVTFAWLVQWLAYLSLLLFVVHFIPGFPLEGGTILRAVLWKTSGKYNRASLITTRIGQTTGAAFFVGGAFLMYNRQWFVGIMLAFLGLILFFAATRSSQNLSTARSLAGMTVQQVMSRQFSVIPAGTTLDYLVKDFVTTIGHLNFVVMDEDRLLGSFDIDDIKSVPRRRWAATPVSQVMTPSSRQPAARTDQAAADLLERMNLYGLRCLPVLEGNNVAGIAIRDEILRYDRTRARLRI
jgi:CBS domain-containing protein/Zn-dependent protease